MARTPFKLKSGNRSAFKEMGSTSMSFQDLANKAKDDANKLHDNLQVIGTNVQEFKQKRKDVVESKRLASEDKKTNFQRRADERKEQRKTGESKFQADVRKSREKKVSDKKTKKVESKLEPQDPKLEIKGNFSTAKTYTPPKAVAEDEKQTFKQAFASAKKANKGKFTWDGNPYTTKLKDNKVDDKTVDNKKLILQAVARVNREENLIEDKKITEKNKFDFNKTNDYSSSAVNKKSPSKKRGYKKKRKK